MSHGKLRHNNNCLNCNAIVQGRFCGICGQENLETKESLGQIIRHFFEDITHFDGKFFSSLKLLLFKPGLLSAQYRIGKRARYLNPVRMYIFTSFVFFLIIFTLKSPEVKFDQAETSGPIIQFDDIEPNGISTNEQNKVPEEKETLAQYKNKQDTARVKDNTIDRFFKERQLAVEEKYAGDNKKMLEDVMSRFLHSLPQFLFVSLPFLALLLLMLYSRRKQFNYVNHAIFIIHYYIFIFIIILFILGIKKLGNLTDWSVFSWINRALLLYGIYYLYRAMVNYYQQGKGKTFLKYFLFLFGILFIMMFLLVLFMSIAFFNL